MKHASCVFGNVSVRKDAAEIDLWSQVRVKCVTFNRVCDSDSDSSAHEELLTQCDELV